MIQDREFAPYELVLGPGVTSFGVYIPPGRIFMGRPDRPNHSHVIEDRAHPSPGHPAYDQPLNQDELAQVIGMFLGIPERGWVVMHLRAAIDRREEERLAKETHRMRMEDPQTMEAEILRLQAVRAVEMEDLERQTREARHRAGARPLHRPRKPN